MSAEENKAIVRRYLEEVWGQGQAALLAQLFAADVCDHYPVPGQPRGLEGQRWALDMFRGAVPDMRVTVEVLVAEGDKVMDRWTATGTQTGAMMGLPATGKRFTMTGSDLCRIEAGKIAEIWHVEDTLAMLQQLGLAPAGRQPSASASAPTTATGRAAPQPAKTPAKDEIRALVRRRYAEFIDRGNLAAADTLVTPDYIGHISSAPTIRGRDALKQFLAAYDNALSDHHAEVEDILVEGDMAACRITFTGKHTGNLLDIPASGKRFTVRGLSLFRFAGEQIAEQWANDQDLELLQQIGAVPAMAAAEMPEPC